MNYPWSCWSSLFALLVIVAANTEKVIFSGPAPLVLSGATPGLNLLHLQKLSPTSSSLRTTLSVQFASEDSPSGSESWYLLRHLGEGQRYEVRICWAATQPTAFSLDLYSITNVFDTPDLITSLASFSESRIQSLPSLQDEESEPRTEQEESILFLRIRSAADFFTSNKTLMQQPLPVDVDVILDPYLGNVLPKSLVSTVVYLILLGLGSVFISSSVWKHIQLSTKHHGD